MIEYDGTLIVVIIMMMQHCWCCRHRHLHILLKTSTFSQSSFYRFYRHAQGSTLLFFFFLVCWCKAIQQLYFFIPFMLTLRFVVGGASQRICGACCWHPHHFAKRITSSKMVCSLGFRIFSNFSENHMSPVFLILSKYPQNSIFPKRFFCNYLVFN